MAQSTCTKCGSSSFEMKVAEPNNSRVKVNFIQCSSCGGVVGAVDFMDTYSNLQVLSKQVREVEQNLTSRTSRLEALLARH